MRFKPPFPMRQFWWSWTKSWFMTRYYRIFHGIDFDHGNHSASILPALGKGKFVSVIKRGAYIDIIAEDKMYYDTVEIEKGDFIRIIPIQYNHGIAVEYWKGGKMTGRNMVGMEAFVTSFISSELG